MKILVNGFSANETIDFVPNLVQELNTEQCFWITDFLNHTYESDKIKILDRVTYSSQLDNQGYKDSIPLNSDLIEKLYECESIFLKMMDRIELHQGNISYSERKRSYYNQLKFWNNFLLKERITCFISSNLPHETYDFIIYNLCKLYNIPFYSFLQIETDFVLLCTDIKEVSKLANQKLKEDNLLSKKYSIEDFSPRAQRIYNKYLGIEDTIPFYMNKKFRKLTKSTVRQNYLKRIFNKKRKSPFDLLKKSAIKQLYFRVVQKKLDVIKSKRLNQAYKKLSTNPDFQKDYIYIPLHYQPEMTTCPLAEIFVDQHLIIDILAATIPNDVYLYIKEHPTQKCYGRTSDYYKNILAYKNTVLVAPNISSDKLIANAMAVATATGTAGWEALFQEKPVLVFGNAYYSGAKGTFRIHNETDSQKAIKEIQSNKKTHTINDVLAYLKALDLIAIIGNSNAHYQNQSLYQDNNPTVNNLITTLIEKIKLETLNEESENFQLN